MENDGFGVGACFFSKRPLLVAKVARYRSDPLGDAVYGDVVFAFLMERNRWFALSRSDML